MNLLLVVVEASIGDVEPEECDWKSCATAYNRRKPTGRSSVYCHEQKEIAVGYVKQTPARVQNLSVLDIVEHQGCFPKVGKRAIIESVASCLS